MGQNNPIDTTWERLILVSFSKERSKKQFSDTWDCQLPVIKPVHRGSGTIILVTFFGEALFIYLRLLVFLWDIGFWSQHIQPKP